MPKNPDIKKILVLGSDPIVIGQAAEFDHTGTRVCRSPKEEGVEAVLLNPNSAAITTDKDTADRVYIEPLTVEVVEQLILKEKPDNVSPTLGGQTGLNLAMELRDAGFFKEHNVHPVDTTTPTIKKVGDREVFKETMERIGELVVPSDVVEDVKYGLEIAEKVGYPVAFHPAYTLDGSGGGTTASPEQCAEVPENGPRLSRMGRVLVGCYIAGWREIEYEVMRDGAGNVITVCNMEDVDPVGVHTEGSIVVAPSQTLGDREHQMLRISAPGITSELGITGDCNVQYALSPDNFKHCAIEVNPRVSRSSALANKVVEYLIAKAAAKIALGYTLDEIRNVVTRRTYVSFEPMLGYCVVRMPRLPFDKFVSAKRTLDAQMETIGEVMSVCTSFEGALMKAIRPLEQHVGCLSSYGFTGLSDETLGEGLNRMDGMCVWRITEALRYGFIYEQIHDVTRVDFWPIDELAVLVEMEDALKTMDSGEENLTAELLAEAKKIGYLDNVTTRLAGTSQEDTKKLHYDNGIHTVYKMVGTCAAEFTAETPCYYSCFGGFNETEQTAGHRKVLVLGSGPTRVGQGIEFDSCSIHSTWAFSREGYEATIVNNNPETVSMDFDIADKLYFEPLTPEDMGNIVDTEKSDGTVMQFGGQTAIKLTEALMKVEVLILGAAAEDVGAAEDREHFNAILEQCNTPRPTGHTVFTAEEAEEVIHKLGHPVLMRPSCVLDERGMWIVISDEDVDEFIGIINQIAREYPILVGKYIMGRGIGADVVCGGTDILIPGIMQHIECTSIHSGDSISVYPAQDIIQYNIDTIVDYTKKLARALHAKDVINIQFIVDGNDVYIVEMGPRSSQTVPYISKVTGIPVVLLATRIICGHTIRELGYKSGLQPAVDYIATKVPVFSFGKIRDADASLGPEMKSTGECLGIIKMLNGVLYKAFERAGVRLLKYKEMVVSVRHSDQEEAVDIAHRFTTVGYQMFATRGTARALNKNGVKAYEIHKLKQESLNILDLALGYQIDLIIDIPVQGAERSHDGLTTRHNVIGADVNVLASLDMTNTLVTSLENRAKELTLIDIATVKNA